MAALECNRDPTERPFFVCAVRVRARDVTVLLCVTLSRVLSLRCLNRLDTRQTRLSTFLARRIQRLPPSPPPISNSDMDHPLLLWLLRCLLRAQGTVSSWPSLLSW